MDGGTLVHRGDALCSPCGLCSPCDGLATMHASACDALCSPCDGVCCDGADSTRTFIRQQSLQCAAFDGITTTYALEPILHDGIPTIVPSCHIRYNLPITKSHHNDCGPFHCRIERNRTPSCAL